MRPRFGHHAPNDDLSPSIPSRNDERSMGVAVLL